MSSPRAPFPAPSPDRSTMPSRLVLLLVALLAFAGTAEAQTAGRARVRGEVSGLELALDGGLTAARGGTLRFTATLYEVLGLSELRLPRSARIEVTSSIDPTARPLSVNADAHGRVLVELPVPEDAPDVFGIVLRAVSGAVQRRFELSIGTYEPRQLDVAILRAAIPPGGRVPAAGTFFDRRTGAPLPGARVTLTLRDESARTLLPPVEVVTDEAGLFAHVFALPDERSTAVSVVAQRCDEDGLRCLSSSASVRVARPSTTPLLVAIAPGRRVVEPASSVEIDVVVRTGEGRPVSGAVCATNGFGTAGSDHEERTDARGRARFVVRVPDSPSVLSDVTVGVRCGREAIGAGAANTSLRIARVERAASFAVEGGALVPALGGRIWARVVTVDGRPAAAGVAVELSGPRIGTLSATTDASGVAVFDVAVGDAPRPARRPEASEDEAYEEELAATDNCGGEAATEIALHAAGAAVVSACVPLDPDGTLRVRAAHPVVAPGGSLELEIARVASVRLPVAVSVIRLAAEHGAEAVAQRVIAAGESRLSIPLPAGIGTEPLLVRARPLHGAEGREVRGGAAMVWVGRVGWTLDARLEGGALRLPSRSGARAYVIGLPLDELAPLAGAMAGGRSPFPELGALPGATEALLAGALAARTTRDVGAPFVLRGGALTPVPAPADPVALGLLRDPWRSQARFVTGRLALVFSAIERRVAEAVPERIEDVAVEAGGRFDFNAQILASVAESGWLGAEGATGLGGEDLTADALRAFDPAFTYDNVARRITRERLFRIMVALRSFVQQNGFDLPWARLGDPSTWLRALPETYSDALPAGTVGARELVDGWGRPFVLRAVARPRFGGWSPLSGWEVASPGPDGRIGNGDDLYDPSARVLPSGSPYAEAVGEDALVARLRGVELGRATVELLAASGATEGYVEAVPASAEEAGATVSLSVWSELPSRLPEILDPLGLRRPDRPADFVLGELRALDGASVPVPFDDEPRTWGVAVIGTDAEGSLAVDVETTLAGSPFLVERRLPPRVRVGEALRYEVLVTNVSERDRSVTLGALTEGPLRASLGAAAETTLAIRAGTSAPVSLELSGEAPGHGHLVLRIAEAGGAVRTLRHGLAVDAGRHPIRTRSAGLAAPGASYEAVLPVPSAAEGVLARLVLLAPDGLAYDPDLSEVREEDPALLAWSLAMAGRPLDEELRASLLRSESGGSFAGADANLSTACALVALAGADEADRDAADARDRARSALAYAWPTFPDDDPVAGGYRGMAAVLAAIAPGGVYDPASGEEASTDPVAAFGGRLRTSLRRALRTHPDEPAVMARTAAALLAADPRDARALAMYERAAAHLVPVRGGRLVAPSAARPGPLEQLTASLALAVAAHQVGDDALAEDLVRALALREDLVLSRGGEPLFWWLALGAYGVLGAEPPRVRLDVGGGELAPSFAGGVAVVPIEGARAGGELRARVHSEGLVIGRLEAVYGVPFEARTDAPFTLSLDGEPGSLHRLAALELAVTATAAVARPVLHLQLPAGVVADEALLRALRAAPSVVSAEARRPALVRLELRPMGAGTVAILPLPLVWTAAGEVRGLAAVVHDAERPEAMTVLPARTFAIE